MQLGTPPISASSFSHSAIVLKESCIVLLGGRSSLETSNDNDLGVLHEYDSVNDSWSTLKTAGNVPSARFSMACTLVGNQLVVTGGASISQSSLQEIYALDTIRMFSLQTLLFTLLTFFYARSAVEIFG